MLLLLAQRERAIASDESVWFKAWNVGRVKMATRQELEQTRATCSHHPKDPF
ncbi:hypothetical protein CALCODRAFT_490767 [Calocera cornea HHB12733]|uniref:Uncharacterized protein n=1 Tax=Calocera cornea HHB12733 TaxID=1353952 RepID=A0A165JHK9_9BASI|nr:hypothetical protein CALCODRAFT_490767 [Calocera cornea HHB12733]